LEDCSQEEAQARVILRIVKDKEVEATSAQSLRKQGVWMNSDRSYWLIMRPSSGIKRTYTTGWGFGTFLYTFLFFHIWGIIIPTG
jgi:hypothetical protein